MHGAEGVKKGEGFGMGIVFEEIRIRSIPRKGMLVSGV